MMPFKDIERKREWNREWYSNNLEKAKLSKKKSLEKKKIEFSHFLKTTKGQLYLLEQEKYKRLKWDKKIKHFGYQHDINQLSFDDLIKQKKQEKHLRYRKKQRLLALSLFNSKCKACGIEDTDVLEFDHIKPLLRKTNGIKNKGDTFAKVLKEKNPHEVYQVLCANCHRKKTRLNNEFSNPTKQ